MLSIMTCRDGSISLQRLTNGSNASAVLLDSVLYEHIYSILLEMTVLAILPLSAPTFCLSDLVFPSAKALVAEIVVVSTSNIYNMYFVRFMMQNYKKNMKILTFYLFFLVIKEYFCIFATVWT